MEIPEPIEPDRLRELDEEALDAVAERLRAAERSVITAMAPFDQQLREVRARLSMVATERRRRERAAHVAQRAGVRERAKSGAMPSLSAALEAADGSFGSETPLTSVRAFLATGGEVGFGFATRPGTIAFTDGMHQRQAGTWGEAVELHSLGWDPGAPSVPGVRVHLAGSRVERVVPAAEVVVDTGAGDVA